MMTKKKKEGLHNRRATVFLLKSGGDQKIKIKKVYTSAEPVSRQFIDYTATKSEFISIACSFVNTIGKSKIAPLKGKIAPNYKNCYNRSSEGRNHPR